MTKIISSQRYVDYDVVEEKIADNDFIVQVSPEFIIDGETYRVILDGHHSYHAAIDSDNTPEYVEQREKDNDRISLLEKNVDSFLEACYQDDNWYDIKTGEFVF